MKTGMDMNLFSVVEDSPYRLVLENKGPRLMSALGTVATVVALGFFLPSPWYQAPSQGDDLASKAAPFFFGAMILLGVFQALDREQIVFESGMVRFTRPLMPWRSLFRPISEIEKVDIRSETTTAYGEDSTKYALFLVLRDERPREINRTHDREFIQTLAARIEDFRR
jgi:hypothetical protein